MWSGYPFRGDIMKKLIKKIILYIKAKEIWDAKMSEHLKIRIISEPLKTQNCDS